MSQRIITIRHERIRPTDDIFVPKKYVVIREDIYKEMARRPSLHFSTTQPIFAGAELFFSVLALVLILPLSIVTTQLSTTVSYFNDTEKILGNTLYAGTLDFNVTSSSSLDVFVKPGAGGEQTIVPIMTSSPDSFPISYSVTAQKTAGVDAFCNALHLTATSAPFIYDSAFMSLVTATTTTVGAWPFVISLPADVAGVSQGDVCSFDLLYSGNQDGVSGGGGYRLEKKLSIIFHADIPAPPVANDSIVLETEPLVIEEPVPASPADIVP